MLCILRWGSLWVAFPSVSALQFVSVFPCPKKDLNIHTLFFLLLELRVICELYSGYSVVLG